jgi:hypothetical protein
MRQRKVWWQLGRTEGKRKRKSNVKRSSSGDPVRQFSLYSQTARQFRRSGGVQLKSRLGYDYHKWRSSLSSQSFQANTKIVVLLLWRDARKPEWWSQNRPSLLGNDSVNTFRRQRIHNQHSSNFRCIPNNKEAVFSAWSLQSGYKEEFSFEMPACQDMSLGADKLKWVESSELAVTESWQEKN